MKIKTSKFFRTLVVAIAAMALVPVAAFAQPGGPGGGPPPGVLIDQPPELAAVRARFENMTAEAAMAAGYMSTHDCVSSPFGNMGIHFIHPQLFDSQIASGVMDPQNPPVLLVDANDRVVGLEWETTQNTPQPTFLGQKVPLQPGHPGMEEEHYMVHIYFKPNNKLLLGTFDPDLKCPAGAAGGAGGPPEGAGGTVGMPRTGNPAGDLAALSLAIAAGLAVLAAGATLRKRKA
jgi:hypothetical protein